MGMQLRGFFLALFSHELCIIALCTCIGTKKTYIIVVIIVVVVIVYDTGRYWDSAHKEIHESKGWYSASRWACSFGFLFGLFSFINFVSSFCSAKKYIFGINDVCNCFMYMVELLQIWNTVILSLIMSTGMINWVWAI